MERKTFFADVLLPVSVPNLYTYRVPHEFSELVRAGQRVIVPFGKAKLYTGIIRNVHENPPQDYVAKYLETVLDTAPIIHPEQFKLWEWMSAYYLCNTGEVMNAALPSGLKLSSETKVVRNDAVETDSATLTDTEYLLFESLMGNTELSMPEVSAITGLKSNYGIIRSLLEKKVIILVEEVKERFKPKRETRIRLGKNYSAEATLAALLQSLEKKAPKQVDALMEYIRLSRIFTDDSCEVRKSDLLKAGENSAISALIKKEILESYDVEVGRLASFSAKTPEKELSTIQLNALKSIQEQFATRPAVLLHGVTSSGKTEIYTRLIRETLERGQQVLYLIPEIAITTQLVERLQNYFGDAVGVYHSRFNENERVEVWNEVLKFPLGVTEKQKEFQRFSVIVGARSSLFLPWSKLGLIIIDEEHDPSFKQQDPAPRYQARDTALFMASLFGAKTLLGSATPSIETYQHARSGKFGLVTLGERHGGTFLPEIHLVDMREEWKKKTVTGHFSPQLLAGIRLALDHKEQVILFQNRRGFAPVLECQWCSWKPVCVNCDVSLVFHKTSNQMRCHYCGFTLQTPTSCSACGDTHLKLKGFGTEQIEEELALSFPGVKIGRLDLDTTRSRFAHFQIVQEFSEGTIQILVGTQMITKGLDFEHVTLVGIMDADGMLGFPDFRAHERAFQLMEQVAGRAGRRAKRGNVIIQTRQPEHPVIQHLVQHDYETLFKEEFSQRKALHFPPDNKLIEFLLQHKDAAILEGSSGIFAEMLRSKLGERVLGPEVPMIPRVRNMFRKKILIRIEEGVSLSGIKKEIRSVIHEFQQDKIFRQLRIHMDVDPS